MKRIFSVFLCLTVWLSVSAYDFKVGGIYYDTIGNGQVEVAYNMPGSYYGSVVIPLSVTYTDRYGETHTYSVTAIGLGAFRYCTGLESVTIPSSVTSIASGAFEGCSGLTSVTIPSSVTFIGNIAFKYCSSLTSISVATNNTVYNSRNNCNAIIETATNKLIAGCKNTVIPNGVTSIGQSAFEGCTGLTSVTIPNSVTTIGQSAFAGCTGLTSVTIPNSVTTIGQSAFKGCCGLKSISIPSSVTTIESSTFEDCTGLISVTIPSSVTMIDRGAFENCVGLISVTIPSSVEKIIYGAFKGCSGLESISVAANNTFFDSRNGCNAIIVKATNRLIVGCINTTIPYGVTEIFDDAFYGCIGLTSVTIPSSVTHIGDAAFYGCIGLASITIPSSVTSIGYDAFNGCGGLTSISIPSSVTDIYGGAFENCPNIEDITCYAITPPTIRATTFENYDATLYVPASRISLYQITDYWKEFNNIQPTTNIRYTVTVNANNEQMGTTIGSGTYDENTIVQLIAIPNSGYVFQQWNDGNTDNPRNLTVTHDSLFTAYFALPENEHYTFEDQGVYYIGGKVYNSQNLYIKLYYSDGKLLSSGTNDIDMSSCPNGIYIVTDGKGGFLKINHYR